MTNRWSERAAAAALLLLTAAPGGAQAAPPPPLPAATEILGEMIARLPSRPVVIAARIETRAPGAARRATGLDIAFHSTADRTRTRYTLTDAFGRPLRALEVERENTGTCAETVARAAEDPLAPAPPPPLAERVADTAFSWADLTLAFLWWTEGKTIGREEVRGQPCWVVDVWAPAAANGPYARVRVWLDTRALVLLKAEGYDRQGRRLRTMTVRSFKKIGEEWMIKDLDVRDETTGASSRLRVDKMSPTGEPSATGPDAGAEPLSGDASVGDGP